MKNYKKEITVGILLAVLFGGAAFWFIKYEPAETLKIVIAGLIILIGLVTFVRQVTKRRRDLQLNLPAEDEFTEKAKLFAGSQAFLYSMYLWFLIFIFNDSFTDNEEMLGIGILGSSAIYFILLWYFKSTSDFSNEK